MQEYSGSPPRLECTAGRTHANPLTASDEGDYAAFAYSEIDDTEETGEGSSIDSDHKDKSATEKHIPPAPDWDYRLPSERVDAKLAVAKAYPNGGPPPYPLSRMRDKSDRRAALVLEQRDGRGMKAAMSKAQLVRVEHIRNNCCNQCGCVYCPASSGRGPCIMISSDSEPDITVANELQLKKQHSYHASRVAAQASAFQYYTNIDIDNRRRRHRVGAFCCCKIADAG
eukprot:COSAG01_NODE_14330_length_1467_cov_2.543860_1_plen_227_part_00